MAGNEKPRLLIGTKGVQYGLQKVAPKKPGLSLAAAAPAARKPANVFGDDDSEEEDVEKQIARQAEKKRAAAKVQQVYEQALAEDPSVFDYDGVYDSMQAEKVQPKQQDKLARQSKYIAGLLETAQHRKREQDVLYERRMVKERKAEDHLFEDKEVFVTSAYRKKLEEDKKWQEAERQKELEEERRDVRKVGHMGNFYANLLTKNVAFGAKDKEQEKEKEEEGSKERGRSEERGRSGAAEEGEEGGERREGSQQRSASPQAQGPSAKVLATLDQYDLLRLEAEKALREKKRREQEQGAQEGQGAQKEGSLGREEGREAAPVQGREGLDAEGRREVAAGRGERGREGSVGPGGGGEGEAVAGGAAAAAAAGKRRNDEGAVQSARERYLARKMQKTG